MKMFICRFLCALVVATPVFAQDAVLLNSLRNTQTDPPAGSAAAGLAGAPVRTEQAVVPSVAGTDQGGANCLSRDKKTIPLSLISGMLRTRGDSLRVDHNPANGQLTVKSGPAISNCSAMVEWNLRAPSGSFNNYVVEAKVKDCGEASCPFTVVEVLNGEHVEKDVNVAPTYAGYLECLKQTGAITAEGGVENSKVVRQNIDVKFQNVRPNGRVNVYFGSQLPDVSPLYSEVSQASCYMLEDIVSGGFSVLSEEAQRTEEIERQAAVICRSQDYRQIQDFVERYGATSLGLDKIARDLILNGVQGLAAKSKSNESISNEDLSVIDDFQSGVIEPLVNRMSALYNEIQRLSPNDPVRRRKQQELTQLASKLESYGRAPYLTEADINKLMDQGRFDEAETLNGIRLTISNYSRLGGEIDGRKITPNVAAQRVDDAKFNFSDSMKQRRIDYDVRTGRITGRSDYYKDLAAAHRRDIQDRNADFAQRIQEQIARATPPSGVCYRMILSTSIQNCITTAQQCVQRLQRQLASWNQEDLDIATRLDAKATRYAALEQEGRRYAGESDDQEETRASSGQDDLEPAPERNPVRAQVDTVPGEGQYNFTIPGAGQQQPFTGNGMSGTVPWGSYGAQGGQVLGSSWGQPQQQGGWYGQVGQGQYGAFQQPGVMGQSFGAGATYNQQAFMGQQMPWMQQPQYGIQQQYGMPQQQGGWYGQAGAYNPQQQLYSGYNPGMSFFGQQQNPYMMQGGVQTLPYMQQPSMFGNPAYQAMGTPQAGWYGR